ncbi:MAG: MBL fold metallo-hydrolase [Acidobacteriota bacterium]|nr:MBL fold metallo-hydrolase [Acidobacteriota bacterium]
MRPTHRLATTCLVVTALAFGLTGCGDGEAPPDGTILTDTHTFEEVAPGVYFIVGRDDVIFVQSNAMLVVTDEDALVVDSHVTPAAARALIASIAEVTDKPVTHLVNTHYHFDHAHGNQSFPENTAIVGHEFTRAMLMTDVMSQPTASIFTGNIPNQIAAMKGAADAMEDGEEKDQALTAIRIQEAHYVAVGETEPTPPNVTLTSRMTIHRTYEGQDRPIELLHLGRGHTGGDVVVLLPNERVVFTGDLVLAGAAYIGDAYVDEWLDTLDRFEELEFDLILPGHGPTFSDMAQVDALRQFLADFWNQASAAHEQGLSPEEAIAEIEWQGFLAAAPDALKIHCVQTAYSRMDGDGDPENTDSA